MKFPHRYKIYDVLHKSAVAFLISGTLVGIAMFVSQGYFYFRGKTFVSSVEKRSVTEA